MAPVAYQVRGGGARRPPQDGIAHDSGGPSLPTRNGKGTSAVGKGNRHDKNASLAEGAKIAYFPSDQAYLRRISHRRHHLTMVDTIHNEYKDHILFLNSYLPYFPRIPNEELIAPSRSRELRDTLDRAQPVEWHITRLGTKIDIEKVS